MRRFPTSLLCAGALLLGAVACSDDDDSSASDETSSTTTSASEPASPTTLANGVDVELVGEGLGDQTLNISAEEADGEVTGEFRVTEDVIRIDCADTDTDGVIILGGEVTAQDNFEGLLALIIKEGDPDSVALYGNDTGTGSCTEMLESISDEMIADASNFAAVEAGSDIET